MPRKPGSPGLPYKKMQADKMFGDTFKRKPMGSDATRVASESPAMAAAKHNIKVVEPADLWHHYNNSVAPDVNAGMKLYPKVKK